MIIALDVLRAGSLLTTALIAVQEDLWSLRLQYTLLRRPQVLDLEKALSYTRTILNLE